MMRNGVSLDGWVKQLENDRGETGKRDPVDRLLERILDETEYSVERLIRNGRARTQKLTHFKQAERRPIW